MSINLENDLRIYSGCDGGDVSRERPYWSGEGIWRSHQHCLGSYASDQQWYAKDRDREARVDGCAHDTTRGHEVVDGKAANESFSRRATQHGDSLAGSSEICRRIFQDHGRVAQTARIVSQSHNCKEEGAEGFIARSVRLLRGWWDRIDNRCCRDRFGDRIFQTLNEQSNFGIPACTTY